MRAMIAGALAAVASIALSGCATPYQTEVSSLVAPTFNSGATHRVAGTPEQEADLGFAQVKAQTERALTVAGLTVVQAPPSDVLVYVDYTVGAPRTVTSSSDRIGQTGVMTTGSAVRGGNGAVVGSSVSTPTYGVVGTSVSSSTVYDRQLRLRAYDAAGEQSGARIPLWQAEVRSSGVSGDILTLVPVMLTAATPYIGKSSGGARRAILLGPNETIRSGAVATATK